MWTSKKGRPPLPDAGRSARLTRREATGGIADDAKRAGGEIIDRGILPPARTIARKNRLPRWPFVRRRGWRLLAQACRGSSGRQFVRHPYPYQPQASGRHHFLPSPVCSPRRLAMSMLGVPWLLATWRR